MDEAIPVSLSEEEVLLSPDVFGTKPLWYAIWQPSTGDDAQAADRRLQTAKGGSGRRFVATSYESVLIGLGVPHNRRRIATGAGREIFWPDPELLKRDDVPKGRSMLRS